MPGLTLQQIQQMGGTPITNTPATSPQGMTLAQIQQMGGTPVTPETSPNYFQRVGQDIKQGIQGYGADINSNDNRSAFSKGVSAVSNVASAVASPLTEAPGFKQIGGLINKAIQAGGNALSNLYTPQFKEQLAQLSPEDYAKATQPLQDLANTGNIANTILMAKGGEKTVQGSTELGTKVASGINNTVNSGIDKILPNTDNPRAIIGEQFRKTAEQYTRPGNLLAEAENQHGTNPIGVLESYGNKVIPKLEGGKITAQSIEEPVAVLESGIAKLSNLKNDAVFLNDNTISPSEYIKYIQDTAKAQASKGWSQMKINDAQNAISKFANKLNETYPNDTPIPLRDIDQLKTEQTGLSKSYKNLSAKPFELDAHGIIGSASKDLVEKFTDNAPTKELNKLIQSHYDAIDLLDSLRGKTPHGGRFAQAAEMLGGTVVGAVAGLGAGHPFLGAMFGRAGAHVMDSLLRSDFISDPLKRMLIKDMSIKDPAILKQMNDYIDANSPNIKNLGDYRDQGVPQPNNQPMNNPNKTATTNIINKQ